MVLPILVRVSCWTVGAARTPKRGRYAVCPSERLYKTLTSVSSIWLTRKSEGYRSGNTIHKFARYHQPNVHFVRHVSASWFQLRHQHFLTVRDVVLMSPGHSHEFSQSETICPLIPTAHECTVNPPDFREIKITIFIPFLCLQTDRNAVARPWSTLEIPYEISSEMGKPDIRSLHCVSWLSEFHCLCIFQRVGGTTSSPRWRWCLNTPACPSTSETMRQTTWSSNPAEGLKTLCILNWIQNWLFSINPINVNVWQRYKKNVTLQLIVLALSECLKYVFKWH